LIVGRNKEAPLFYEVSYHIHMNTQSGRIWMTTNAPM